MKKLGLVLLICLCACGQGSSSRISLFNEANGAVGNRPPSGYIEDGDSYWKSRDLSVGKDWIVLQTNGDLVEQALVGCLFADTGAQTKWLKESYDTLIANKWVLLSDDGGVWVLMKEDKLASGVSSVDNDTISASVVFMSLSTALGDSTGDATDSGTVDSAKGDATWIAMDVGNLINYIKAIAYGNGKFVAGGANEMAYSSNGATWTAVADSTFGDGDTIEEIIYSNNRFIAVGWNYNRLVLGNNGGKMATSTDGVTWTAVDSGLSAIYAITYGNGRFVAGGDRGKMAYSSDGVTWTAIADSTFGTSTISAIAYGNGKFAAGGYYGKMAYSSDGITWTAVADSKFDGSTKAIAYGNGKFVAGGNGAQIACSSDGATWTLAGEEILGSVPGAYGIETCGINAIAFGNNRFVAVGESGKIAVSTDGTTWTVVEDSKSGSMDVINAIAYGNGKFVAGGYYGKMAYLPD